MLWYLHHWSCLLLTQAGRLTGVQASKKVGPEELKQACSTERTDQNECKHAKQTAASGAPGGRLCTAGWSRHVVCGLMRQVLRKCRRVGPSPPPKHHALEQAVAA